MEPRSDLSWLTQQDYAHRGLHSFSIPENSKQAAESAIEEGLGVECDIQISRDNIPMVFHDWELDRLTNERGSVAARNAYQLCQIRLGDTSQKIWTLADFLDCVAGRVPILVEIKSLPHLDMALACAAIARQLEEYEGPFAVMSFDAQIGEWFAKNAPGMVRGLVATDTLDHGYLGAWRKPRAIERVKPDFLAFDIRDIPNAFGELWRETGRPLLSWTVRTRDQRAHGEKVADRLIAEADGLA